MGQQKRYLVFLIRLWPAEEGGEPTWRASLESARHAFASLEDLFAYLREQVRAQMQLPDKPGDKP
jgi:hypothetical protein